MRREMYSDDLAGVLIATPNDSLRKRIYDTLSGWQWPVHEAYSGADALDKLEVSECDLLLLDHNLPDLDAMELRQMVKERFPGIDLMMLDGETGWASIDTPLRRTAAKIL